MKKYLILLVVLIAPLFINAAALSSDINDTDASRVTIRGRLISGTPRSLPIVDPIEAINNDTEITYIVNVQGIASVAIVNVNTGEVVANQDINGNVVPATDSIDISALGQGDYEIRFYKTNPKNADDYYYGEFSIY